MNLDELEAMARAATPGPWTVIDAEEPYVRFGNPAQFYDSTILKEQDARFIAACTPERILALIRVARAANEVFIRHPDGTWIGTDRKCIAFLNYALRDLDAL